MTSSITFSNTNWNTQFQRYFDIAIRYEGGVNNNQIGKARLNITVLLTARFGLTSPTIISALYQISKRQALEHLNKLVKRKLLILVETHRSMDGRIYIVDFSGAKFAQELMAMPVPFRRFSPPERGVNQNTIMHDLMNTYILLKMAHEVSRATPEHYVYGGLMTEREFKKLMTQTDTRTVDGLILEQIQEGNCIVAIEIENSFKTKAQRSSILLRYLSALKANIYGKVFMISQSYEILDDIRRLHSQLYTELTQVRSQQTKQPLMTSRDADLLEGAIVYRTKYCDELRQLFYE
ncbi:hypothetical protein GMES_1205 [Paraglaciecola mesophila KMM 241]|uniref:Uncharacterized protein n=1 Tax=Paraglaciecola mesophila KMM 241 TaxID=1128912 RepID=K6XSA7_9ALTE|nr:hypothetical protein [Paraglaciecola mesophila]GAC23504.1 hypothetical protein GMES_1205 [Paraglaciecola mesophila KMM 241]